MSLQLEGISVAVALHFSEGRVEVEGCEPVPQVSQRLLVAVTRRGVDAQGVQVPERCSRGFHSGLLEQEREAVGDPLLRFPPPLHSFRPFGVGGSLGFPLGGSAVDLLDLAPPAISISAHGVTGDEDRRDRSHNEHHQDQGRPGPGPSPSGLHRPTVGHLRSVLKPWVPEVPSQK